MLLCALVLLRSGNPNEKGSGCMMLVAAIIFIIIGFIIKGDGKSNPHSNDKDYWKCPSCGYYIEEDLSFCPKCVKNSLGID